jgi:hypothetical protein
MLSNPEILNYRTWFIKMTTRALVNQNIFITFYDIVSPFVVLGPISSIGVRCNGTLKKKVAPFVWSPLFLPQIVPPCASMILLEMYNPNPAPA